MKTERWNEDMKTAELIIKECGEPVPTWPAGFALIHKLRRENAELRALVGELERKNQAWADAVSDFRTKLRENGLHGHYNLFLNCFNELYKTALSKAEEARKP